MATAKKTAAKPGTAVAVKANSAVMNIQDEIRRKAEQMAERTEPAGGSTIRVVDKALKLPDGSVLESMDLVVVDFTSTQSFYPVQFDPKNPVPPDCFAIGDQPKKLVPSENSPNLQIDKKDCVEGKGCNVCPNFQWGSDGAGKACKSGRKLAVLPPEADKDTPIWILNVSPTAIKSFDGFANACARMGTIPVGLVVTVSCDPSLTYSSLRFQDPRPNDNLEVHYARTDEARQLLAAEPDVSQWKPAAPKGRAAPRGGNARR